MPPRQPAAEQSGAVAASFGSFRSFPLRGWLLIACVGSLTALGLTVLMSAGGGSDGSFGGYFRRQLVWLGAAVFAGTVSFLFGVRRLRRFALVLAVGSAALLVVVLIPGIGVEVNGARRWIAVGGFRFQPSEFAKIGFLCLLAWYVARNGRRMNEFWRGFVVPIALAAPYFLLIYLEPDLGTTVLYVAVAGVVLLLSGTRFTFLLMGVLLAALLFLVAVLDNPERMERLTSFLNIEDQRADGAYQLWQGILGFGLGGVEGVGPGSGRQQLSFLPEAHTDFIFAVVGEELGLFATGGVVVVFGCFTVLVLSQMRKAPDLFQFLLVFGSLLFVVGQALINMGVVTGILPTKGMSLPFISYGGSNLVLVYTLTGLILSAFSDWEKPALRNPLEI